jgi:WD40 repeat protein
MTERSCTSLNNPFPGLRAFGPGDGHLFFGRNTNRDEIIARLLKNRFVSVIGASGTGKSSLVLSGVIPRLLAENSEGKRSWSFVVLRPNNNPIDALATELSNLSAAAGFAFISPIAAKTALHNDSDGLADIVNRIRRNLRQQIVLVIDQFEDIFRYNPEPPKGIAGESVTDFVNLLVAATQQPDAGLHILITMRSEYISECSRFTNLIGLMNSGNYLIPQIKGAGFAEIIEEPLKLSGTPIDSKLVNTIILEAGNKQGQLPLVQHMLMRLWEQWHKCGDSTRSIGISDYEAIGRLEGAISYHAGLAYCELSDELKKVCAKLFRSITYCGNGTRGQRKPEQLSAIQAITGCSIENLISVIEVFRASHYSFLTPPSGIPLTQETVIDVSHESIITSWDLLKGWVDEEEESQKMYLQLASSALKHQEGRARLWAPPELLIAIRWRDTERPTVAWAEKIDPAFERTMLFLRASEEEYIETEEHISRERKKKIKWARLMGVFFGLVSLASVILSGNYLAAKAKAVKNEALAIAAKERVLELNKQLSDSLNITVKSKLSIEAEATAAKIQASTAKEEALIAGEHAGHAMKAMKDAVYKADEESRKRMVSIGKSLAVRSLSYQNNQDLQVLLAYQGFQFNSRFGGFNNDADVFNSLYVLNKKFGNKYYSITESGNGGFTSMTVSPDGKLLFGSDKNGKVSEWQAIRPGQNEKILLTGERVIDAMAVSPDGTWLACGTAGADIIMLPLTENAKSYELNGTENESINSLAYSSDGAILYASTRNGNISEWNFQTHVEKSYRISGIRIAGIDVSSDNKMLAALTTDGRAVLMPLDLINEPRVINTGDERITALSFIPWNKRIMLGNEEGFIEMWDLNEGRAIDIIEAHNGSIGLFAFNPENKQIASAGIDGTIKLWSYEDMTRPPVTFTDNSGETSFIGYSSDGRSIISASASGTIIQRPAQTDYMSGALCSHVARNFTPEEWEAFVGNDIPYEKTCEGRTYKIRVNEIRSSQ